MKRDASGFTLPEVIVALTMTGLLVGIVMSFMINSLTQYSITGARAELLNEAQIALDIAANDIRLSANADANNRWDDANGPGAPTDLQGWESDEDTLVLATAAENNSGDILFSDAANYVSHKNNSIYFVDSGKLYKRVLAAPDVPANTAVTTCPASLASASCPADRLLLQNVESFVVRYFDEQNQEVAPDSARSVELDVKLKVVRYPESVFAEYKTRMVFRND